MKRDSHGENVVHFHLDDFPRQAKLRNAQIKHAAGNRGGLKDFNRVTEQGQIMRTSKAAHAGADNRNSLIAFGGWRQLLAGRIVPGAKVVAVGSVALQCADGNGFVDLATPAIVFTGVRADAAKNVGKWIGRAGQQVRFFVL